MTIPPSSLRPFVRLASLVLVFVSFGLVTGCGEEDDDSEGACESLCARNKCPGDDAATCLSECQMVQTACPSESSALLACFAAVPDADLICDEFDETNVPEGRCDAEAQAALSCVLSK